MMKSIFAACIVSLAVMSAAAAFPLVSVTPTARGSSSDLIDVKSYKSYKSHKSYKGYKPHKKHWHGKRKYNYHPGWKYKNAPKNWHRHSHRPFGWQSRGCIIVGPFWYCP